jgi:hypothetical protein
MTCGLIQNVYYGALSYLRGLPTMNKNVCQVEIWVLRQIFIPYIITRNDKIKSTKIFMIVHFLPQSKYFRLQLCFLAIPN